ncbi:unnamed protein product, partial [Durusdinium trenchii]
MPGHPALKRYGWRADDEEPSCHIAFQSHSDQPAALLWLDGKKAMELAKIPPHGSIAQLSYDGHRFQIRVGEHSSRPVSCRAPSSDFVITKSLDLVEIPSPECCQQPDREALQMQEYFEALLRYIPYVDQCEALREFLCSVDVSQMSCLAKNRLSEFGSERVDPRGDPGIDATGICVADCVASLQASYDALLDLEQALGRGGPEISVDARLIAALPQREVASSQFELFILAGTTLNALLNGFRRAIPAVPLGRIGGAEQSLGRAERRVDLAVLLFGPGRGAFGELEQRPSFPAGEEETAARRGARPREGDWPGCHVAHGKADWILGLEDLRSAGLHGDLPDLSVDPRRKVLSVINAQDETRCFYISLLGHGATGRRGRPLAPGRSWRGTTVDAVTTLVLVVPGQMVMDVCRVKVKDVRSLELHSDILPLPAPPERTPPGRSFVYDFPLEGGPFLCSQGHGGRLTHFAHPSTFYALDFDCAVNTAVLAMEEGVVTQIRDNETASGVDVENFFKWNQITVKQVDGTWAEYVHIQSAAVPLGAAVTRGQRIASSGAVGFCPTAHLHVELHLSDALEAPSVPFGFRGQEQDFYCQQGLCYTAHGVWSASEEAQEENVHMLHGERSVTMWGPDEEQT